MEDDTPRLPPQTAWVAQYPDTPTIDPTPVLRVTWQDQVQVPPAPPQRVEIELLSDDPTPPLQRVPLLPPPWSDYDVATTTGTALIVPTTSAAFTNPNISDRAAQLAARIEELNAELAVSRAYYGS